MTPEEADSAQQWAGMDGATAWHLIERHAENWHEIGELMNAWLRANGGVKWIPCAERLPDSHVTCIVGRADVGWPVTAFWTGNCWSRDVLHPPLHVTHWMPMPTPPANVDVTGAPRHEQE